VTTHTVADIGDSLLVVLFSNATWIVAGKTVIAEQAAWVTGVTGAWTTGTVAERKSMRTVVRRWPPSRCIMARGTVDAKQTGVERRLPMASNTVARYTLENTPGMALETRNLGMGAGKGESGLVVV
jgi:hypothetical protein